jgi:hypothetical protein
MTETAKHNPHRWNPLDWLLLAGVALVTAGVAHIRLDAGGIVLGAFCLVTAYGTARRKGE